MNENNEYKVRYITVDDIAKIMQVPKEYLINFQHFGILSSFDEEIFMPHIKNILFQNSKRFLRQRNKAIGLTKNEFLLLSKL